MDTTRCTEKQELFPLKLYTVDGAITGLLKLMLTMLTRVINDDDECYRGSASSNITVVPVHPSAHIQTHDRSGRHRGEARQQNPADNVMKNKQHLLCCYRQNSLLQTNA